MRTSFVHLLLGEIQHLQHHPVYMTSFHAWVAGGRRVKVATGSKSQTVNVYREGEKTGKYETRLRCTTPALFLEGSDELPFVDSIPELVDWLQREHLFSQEGENAEATPRAVHELGSSDAWMDDAKGAVQGAINRLVDRFVQHPYLHRVEHSLHCELYQLLTEAPLLREPITLGPLIARPVQKEWPESTPRSWKHGRRGNFDLVVLSPADATAGIDARAFLGGYLKPLIAIELGLDYGRKHLEEDDRKIRNSSIRSGYLVHFAREEKRLQSGVREAVEQIIAREATGGPKVAYAHLTSARVEVRRLGEPTIRELPRS